MLETSTTTKMGAHQAKILDQTTGALPCGAIVPGVNDIPDKSCFDIHKCLNVGFNGCPIP
ncbi:MAG TPA: hypothetical protein VHT73_09345 [Thermodesulfobacteriota bacterium]|nr:hypothetical protein [Thermodesulfobacteriota bacterium]